MPPLDPNPPMPQSSGTKTWVIAGIVVVGVALLVLALWFMGAFAWFMPQQTTETATTTPQQETAQQPVNDLPTANNDASDSAITQDSAAIDAEMGALMSDSASVDESLNDKPVSQEY